MGLYDRDYYRDGGYGSPRPAAVNAMRLWSVTTWLIVINVAVFVLDHILLGRVLVQIPLPEEGILRARLVNGLGHFSAHTALAHYQVWRFLTFQFLHGDVMHLVFNMFSLYFFGPLVERYWGSRRYLAFYLLCGVAGPIAYLGLWTFGWLGGPSWVPLVGASAGIFGILVAAAKIAPDATVMLMFPPIPMKLKTMAWVFIGIALLTILSHGRNAGGEAAHLGGAAMGLVLMQYPALLGAIGRRMRVMR